MDLDTLYGLLADGVEEDVPAHLTGLLMRRAREKARSEQEKDRLAALRVAAALGVERGLKVTEMLVNDASLKVRRYAFNQAIAARYDGLPLIRLFASDADADIASEAIDLLTRAVDLQSTPVMRRLLRSPHADVRGRAATLLGHVAGPAVRPELSRIAGSDEDAEARRAALEAIRRIDGELERATPEAWWDAPDDDIDDIALPAPPPRDEFDSLLPPPPAIDMERSTPAAPPIRSKTPPPPIQRLDDQTVPALPAPGDVENTIPSRPVSDEFHFANLPDTLPDEPRALLKLLGMVGPYDRGAVVAALEACDIEAVSTVVADFKTGTDPALGRGCALAAATMARPTWMTAIRRLVFDPDDGVRAAAAEAIGALSGPSGIPSLTMLLGDPAPRVRRHALQGLAVLCRNVDRIDIARQWMHQLEHDPDPTVRETADSLLSDLAE